MASWLLRAARAYPDAPAIARGSDTIADYGIFAERAARLAAALGQHCGAVPGDRVAIVAKNCADYLIALYGIWWAGCAAVPINAKLHGAEIGWILENSKTRICLAGADLTGAVESHAPATLAHLIALGGERWETLLACEPGPLTPRDGDDLAWLFYTSGTTGRPKGAMLTHRNLAAASLAYLSDVDETSPGDGILHAAPMSHGSGIYIMPHVCRAGVNRVPESGGFEPTEIAALVNQNPRTSLFAAPTMIKRLVAADIDVQPGAFRTVVWGGAPMHVADILEALDRFGPVFAQIYGQGETPMTTTVLSKADIADRGHPRWMERLGTAGIVNSAVDVRIADDSDQTLQQGETGEVLVRGDTVMAGYWDNPEQTAQTLRGGWLHTGDVGSFDAYGYLTLRDRSKDVIISGGANIYPREVEEVLLTHPGVREVSVIGRPDPEWGEIVVAYVAGEAEPDALDTLCTQTIARFKRPKDYVFVAALPKNNYGKILKTALRKTDAAFTGDRT